MSAATDVAFGVSRTGMVVSDASGSFLKVNKALCTLLGYPPEELTTLSFRDITLPEDLPASLSQMEHLGDGSSEGFTIEKRYRTARGAELWGRVTCRPVRDDTGALVQIIAQIEHMTERRLIDAAREHAESHDDLTGLVNRKVFSNQLRAALASDRRSDRQVAVLVVNIDGFHKINAGLGTVAGDLILRGVSQRLLDVARGRDTVGRLAGDEFGVLAPAIGSMDEAGELAVQLRRSIGEAYWIDGNPVFVSARIGVVTAPGDGTQHETLVGKAVVACQEAREFSSGWAMYPEHTEVASRREFGLVRDLRLAIENDDLTVAYQPVVDGNGGVHCLEGLARWHHPDRGIVPPDQFIVLAEQNGLIGALTSSILNKAVHQAAEWYGDLVPAAVAVNLSGRLLSDPDLDTHIVSALESAGLSPQALIVEVTESSLVAQGDGRVWSILEGLRKIGVRVSIDDFGTGYSSLAYLKSLPVDELKIDGSFIVDLDSDARSERIVRSIVHLAHSLDLSVVAEGVEDESVSAQLLRMGVDYLQGYAIARPGTGQLATSWLHNRVPASPAGNIHGGDHLRALEVLVLDESGGDAWTVARRLTEHQHRVVEASSIGAALERLECCTPDLIALAHQLPGLNGIHSAPRLREAGYAGPILLFSGSPPDELAASRYPLDVWPVSAADEATFMRLIDGYARTRPPPS